MRVFTRTEDESAIDDIVPIQNDNDKIKVALSSSTHANKPSPAYHLFPRFSTFYSASH